MKEQIPSEKQVANPVVLHTAAGDPPPDAHVDAETSDDEEAPQTCHDEMLLAVASIRVGY